MKNPLKRRKKVQPDTQFKTLYLPVALLKNGGLNLHIDEHGARTIPPEPDLSEMNVPFEIGYDPKFRGSYCWFVSFTPEYSYRGQTFGVDGPALVREIGLDYQGTEFIINEDGRIVLYFQERPNSFVVEAAIKGTIYRVEHIMAEYGRLKAFQSVQKRKS